MGRRELRGIRERILRLISEKPCGLTIEEISREMSISRGSAVKYLFYLEGSGKIIVRELGQSKLHYPNTRRVQSWLL